MKFKLWSCGEAKASRESRTKYPSILMQGRGWLTRGHRQSLESDRRHHDDHAECLMPVQCGSATSPQQTEHTPLWAADMSRRALTGGTDDTRGAPVFGYSGRPRSTL
jgi:hypothetical protein